MSRKKRPTQRRVLRCPICRRPRVPEFRPFCSARCRDVDLARWFNEAYAVPVVEAEEDGEPSATGEEETEEEGY